MTKKILTYGTFDLFHIGHLKLIKRLAEMGELTVAVSTDEFNLGKGKKTIIPFEQRIEIVESIGYVHRAIPEESWDQKIEDIRKYNIDIFAIGDDWQGKFDFLSDYCEVKYLSRTEGVSTTALKQSLSAFGSVNKEELIRALEILETLKNDLC
jgi:glycerol-3-phosphate cytidylyltransferase